MPVILGREMNSMGSVLGLLTMGHSLGMLTGPILAGFMMDAFHLQFAFLAGTVIMVIGTITTLIGTVGFKQQH